MVVIDMKRLSSPADIGESILRWRKRLTERRSLGGVAFLRAYSDLVDGAITRILELAMEETACELGEMRPDAWEGVSLAATGGYGRRELSPFSDIDITFIVADEDDPQVDLIVKRAYRLLMDVFLNGAGLKVGYAYRQLRDCRDLPLDTHTALLDARCVAGSSTLFERFYSGMLKAVAPAEFIFGHLEQRRLALERWGSSPYRVEPNIKEGAGGLRDIQTARWIAQVAFDASREEVWHILRAQGIISDLEVAWIGDAAEFLARLRNALHTASGRGLDILSVDRQDEIAGRLRFKHGASALMAKYFMHAERICGIYRKVSSACLEQPLEIERGMIARNGMLRLLDRGLILREPEAILRVFEHAVTLHLDVSRETADLIREHVASSRCPPARRDGRAFPRVFLRLLSRPGAAHALDTMARLSVLQWLLPEFGRLMNLPPNDPAHEMTVGAHSLEVAKHLESFAEGDDVELREVSANIRERELLMLAALLHDAGKVEPDGSHSEHGAAIAGGIARRLGLRPEAVEQLEFLVRHHLLMSETARLRNLSEKRTVQDFIGVVNSLDLLDMLYLLTAADLRSVGQATWSEVQMSFLRELYHRASTALRGPGTAVDLDRHRGRLARELSPANIPAKEVDEHCRSMPASYLLNTPPDDLASHIAFVRKVRAGKPVVRIRDDAMRRFTEIEICTLDDPEPGLLAKIAGVLAALDVEIHAAQVFTRESYDRIAIDSLYVDCDGHTLTELKKLQVQAELEKVLSGESDVAVLLGRFGKRLRGEINPISLKIMSHLSDQHTVIDIEAEDRPGLLYRLTSAISSLHWDIHSARVSTWGSRARDAFYVTDEKGNKLGGPAAEFLRKAIAQH